MQIFSLLRQNFFFLEAWNVILFNSEALKSIMSEYGQVMKTTSKIWDRTSGVTANSKQNRDNETLIVIFNLN